MSDAKTEETAVEVAGATVFFDEFHDGASGAELADGNRPTIYKLDHNKGQFHSLDDEDEKMECVEVIILNCRIYYRKFKNNAVVCTSDNGTHGFDEELNIERSCDPGSCDFSHKIENYVGKGQCGLGMTIQGLAVMDKVPEPMTINMSGSSARAFSTYLKKLRRKKISMRGVVTRIGSRLITTPENKWYAGDFKAMDVDLTEDQRSLVIECVTKQQEADKLTENAGAESQEV